MRIRSMAKRLLKYAPWFYHPNFITRDTVRWAYRLFLDREPESNAAVMAKLRGPITTIADLRRDMLFSAEFARKNPDIAPFPPATIVIAGLDRGRRLLVDLADTVISCAIVRGDYEPELVAELPRLIEPGSTVMDIGANIGFFTITMAELTGPSGRVIAFEPIAELADLCRRSIAENGFQQRVVLEGSALGDHAGQIQILHVHNARNYGASYLLTGGPVVCATAHDARTVPMITLDEYSVTTRVGFIKIDIEGAEPLCFLGARKFLAQHRPVILSEVHPIQLTRVAHTTPDEYLNLMRSNNYVAFERADARWRKISGACHPTNVVTVLFVPGEHPLVNQL